MLWGDFGWKATWILVAALLSASLHAFRTPKILVLVNSACWNVDRRQAIINTWGGGLNHVDLVFSIGESERCGGEEENNLPARVSIFRTGVEELYRNNILKLLKVFTRDAGEVGGYDYVVKVDDDVYIDELALVDSLTKSPREMHYRGLMFMTKPVRKPTHKNYVSEKCMPLLLLPPFAYGAGYVLSQDLVKYIKSNSGLLRQGLIRDKDEGIDCCDIDDVQIGIWMFAIGVKGWNDGRFNGLMNCHRDSMILFDVPSEIQYLIHDKQGDEGNICNAAVHRHIIAKEGGEKAALRKALIGDYAGAKETFEEILNGGGRRDNAEAILPLIDTCLGRGKGGTGEGEEGGACEELKTVIDRSIKLMTKKIQLGQNVERTSTAKWGIKTWGRENEEQWEEECTVR